MAASLRRNISFPAPRPSHPGARKRRQRITNQPSISSPTTAAAVIPRSSTAFGSQRSSEKHPSPQPLPRQIPIDDQALIALPRVRSSGAFGRRSPYTGSNARVGPASETLNGLSRWLGSKAVDDLDGPRMASPVDRGPLDPAVTLFLCVRLNSGLSGRGARSRPLQPHILQRRRPRKGIDLHQRGLLDARPDVFRHRNSTPSRGWNKGLILLH